MKVDITLTKTELKTLRRNVAETLRIFINDVASVDVNDKELYGIIPRQKIDAAADKLVQVAIDRIAQELTSDGEHLVDRPEDLPDRDSKSLDEKTLTAARRLLTQKAERELGDLENSRNLEGLRMNATAQGYVLTPITE